MTRQAQFPIVGECEVDFGFASGGEGDTASVVVAADWVTSGSVIVCQPCLCNGPDHGAEDPAVENISARASKIIPGVSFEILASAPTGTWGRYRIAVVGYSG